MDPAVNEQYYLLVAAKLRETAAHVIAMSVLVLNLRKIQRALLRMLAYLLEILAQNKIGHLFSGHYVNTEKVYRTTDGGKTWYDITPEPGA